MQDVRPLELKSFDEEVQAQADLIRLREEIKAAEAQREAIRDAARREGLELGRLDAIEHATRVERERVAAETAGLADLLRQAAAALDQERASLCAVAERDLLRLAILVAGKVTKAAVQNGKPVAEENLRRAIELTARRQELKVRLSPQDLARIEEFLPELHRDFSDLQKVVLEADPAIARGGVVVETREGSVDATIAAQLEEIERGLLG
ncbi:MAG TPA: FliH/SctL family protein [Planctomycetota bacterium]|nr:FliH/SctL family protein [Planctomycetota bacterium]